VVQRSRVGSAEDGIVQPADSDIVEWRWQLSMPIHHHRDAGFLERGDDEWVVGAEIVVPEHGELAERSIDLREARRELIDVAGANGDEVTAQQQHVGRERSQRVARFVELPRIRSRARVKVRSERYSERRRTDRTMCGLNDRLHALQRTLEAGLVAECRSPVARPEEAVEDELERASASAGSALASEGPDGQRAAGHSPFASPSSSSLAGRATVFRGRPPFPLVASDASSAKYSRRAAAIASLSCGARRARRAFSR
jgi:hypothetical protein